MSQQQNLKQQLYNCECRYTDVVADTDAHMALQLPESEALFVDDDSTPR